MSDGPQQPESFGSDMVRGSAWTIGLRWSIRLTGLVSTIILARLLTPADFGIVAIAMLVVGTIEVFSQTGQRLALIRNRAPTRQHYDAAWTISFLVGVVLAVTILIIAPFTEIYFKEPAAIVVMQALALRAFIGGLENIGVVDFRRDLRFDRFFRFTIISKIVSFFVTIALAIWLRNYWALVCGILAGQLASNIASYVMHPFRPRFDLTKAPEIWNFSVWTLVRSVGAHLNGNVDTFAVGGSVGATAMGHYTVAADVAASPTNEVNEPMVSVFFPVLSKAGSDRGRIREMYGNVLGWSAIICTATSVGFSLVATDFVNLVLGSQWTEIIPLIPWLALTTGMLGLSTAAYVTLDVLNQPHRGAQLQWSRLLVLGSVLLPIAHMFESVLLIAQARFAVTMLFIPGLLIVVGRLIEFSVRDHAEVFWKPIAAALAMAMAITALHSVLFDPGAWRLLASVIVGALTYVGTLLSLGRLTKHTDTPEKLLLDHIVKTFKRSA